ncbi:MAG: PspA/IM30 family protein [Anaerotignum sp.]|nr:PspA/IM30 family protein [Anaerotignum sp.]
MAGILNRFKTIMEANVNALLDKAEDPVKMADQLARNLEDDLGKTKAETASVMAEVKRAQRAYDECAEAVAKMQQYAEAAVLKGNDADAKAFLAQKAEKAATLVNLEKALDVAKDNADKMRQVHDKLEEQLRQISERKASIRAKAAMAKAKERTAEIGKSVGSASSNLSAFDKLEEQMNRKLDEADALLELNTKKDAVEDLMEKYNTADTAAVDDELAALKEKLGK